MQGFFFIEGTQQTYFYEGGGIYWLVNGLLLILSIEEGIVCKKRNRLEVSPTL